MPANNFTKISFYVVAHADDWQLFMCPAVHKDIMAEGTKTVFIITTAGDAGADEQFRQAREEGSRSSLRFCLAARGEFSEAEGIKKINGHTIFYWCAGNSVFYFMRLPDGNLNGNGFPSTNFESLSKLRTGEVNCITATDYSTTYNGWTDFYTTLETIILAESGNISEQSINYINPDPAKNPNDHPDHIATGQAIQCMPVTRKMYQTLFNGYGARYTAKAINPADTFWKTGMFAAYEKAVFDNSGYSTLKESLNIYLNWCSNSADCIVIEPS